MTRKTNDYRSRLEQESEATGRSDGTFDRIFERAFADDSASTLHQGAIDARSTPARRG
jgi:hypothetical protein